MKLPDNRDEWLKLRQGYVGASEAAALYGKSPYTSYYGLWHAKTHGTTIDDNERMMLGRHLEEGIANAASEKYDLKLLKPTTYYTDELNRLGATLDFITADGQPVEIKNVSLDAYARDWQDGLPLHYRIQLQQQMALTGAKTVMLIALVAGTGLEQHFETYNQNFHNTTRKLASEFWQLVDAGTPPEPDHHSDLKLMTSVLTNMDDTTADLSGDEQFNQIAEELAEVMKDKKTLTKVEKQEKILKAKLVGFMGTHKKAVAANGLKITRSEVAAAEVSYTRDAYVSVRVTLPKEKK